MDQPQNQNIIKTNNLNQSVNQANDTELYTTMKKVIEESKSKVPIEQKKDIEEEEEEKIVEEKESLVKPGSLSLKRKLDYNKLNEEFKDIFNKKNSNINDTRRCLFHMIIIVAVCNCIAWEFDCLFLNACYGENVEMERWISACLFPLIIFSIFLLYLLFMTVNYLRQIPITIVIWIYLAVSITLVVIGIISIVKGSKYKLSDDNTAESVLKDLTIFENDYYENYDKGKSKVDNLKYLYYYKMVFTGSLNIIIGVMGVIIFIKSALFNSLLSQTAFDWRPPLRSHIRISRIKKAIELYAQNSESYVNIFRSENPHYQFDDMDNKELRNKFGSIKGSVVDSNDISKDKRDISNIQNNNNENNNDEIVLPKAKKRVLQKNQNDKESEKNTSNINNKENEINTNSNNLINNNINNINENNHINNNINHENENNINNQDNNKNKENV